MNDSVSLSVEGSGTVPVRPHSRVKTIAALPGKDPLDNEVSTGVGEIDIAA
jgi:hypothetical protein